MKVFPQSSLLVASLVLLCPTGFAVDPVTGTGTGLVGIYYANEKLAGDPVLSRLDAQINFSWAGASPDPLVPVDHFSVRWQGDIQPRYSEDYTLTVRTDDGVRVWLDNALVIDSWITRKASDSNYTFTAVAGQRYAIRMEYFDHTGSAMAALSWQSAHEPVGVVPANQLYQTPVTGNGTGLLAGYFPGPSFSGKPTIKRDPTIDFSWPPAPIDGFPSDYFSVRWQGRITPKTLEPTTLILTTDDGMRMWIDGAMVINDWKSHGVHGTMEHRYTLPAGLMPHDIRIDYFEDYRSASAKLEWESATIVKEIVPSTQLIPAVSLLTPSLTNGSGLSAALFASEDFTGVPWMRRDRIIDFNWGNGAPDPTMPADHFSIRWSGKIQTRFAEPYDLIMTVDDGVRIWVDGIQVIDSWAASSVKERRCTIAGGAGVLHALKIEHVERTGGAVAKLEWESPREGRQGVPEKCLYPNDLDVELPTASKVSPVFIEGIHRPGLSVSAGGPAVSLLGTSRFATNVPLNATAAITARIASGSGIFSGPITWTPTELVGSTSLTIRPGDSLLLSCLESGTMSISLGCGTYRSEAPIAAGNPVPVAFTASGRYTVTLKNASAVEIARLHVDVPGVTSTSGSIPCSVYYQRIKDIDVKDAMDKTLLCWTSSDDWISAATASSPSDSAATTQRVTIKPALNIPSALLARINGIHGPIMKSWPITPFTIRSNAEKHILVNSVEPDGSVVCGCKLIMNPLVPNLRIKMYTLFSGVTFDDSTTLRWISSAAFTSITGGGEYAYGIISAPSNLLGVCNWRIAYDGDIQVSP